jgi:5-hydroxyisourate hydrolase
MATVSSHILDSIAGGPAVGIRVVLYKLPGEGGKQKIFDVTTDGKGLIDETVDPGKADKSAQYELVFHSADYFAALDLSTTNHSVMKTVVLRFTMADRNKRYHMPITLAPHSYSVCW